VLLLASNAKSQQRDPANAADSKPVATITVPSKQRTYDDLKLVFNLANDEKGYQTFKETLEEFLVGIESDKPSGIRLVLADDGIATVFSAPIKDEAAFQKFLSNLWDLDVKTAPPPAHVKGQMPKPVQEKLHSLKLQHNERVVYDLADGVLRFENGYVHLGKSLAAVRMVHGGPTAPLTKDESLTVDMQSDIAPQQRRAAFEKSKDDLLERPRRDKFKDDATFELAKAAADFDLARLELVVADSSQLHAVYTVNHDKKTSQFEAEVIAAPNTPLASMISRIGHAPDAFAPIATDNADLVANFNLPNDPALGRKLKDVAAKAKAMAEARIDASSKIEENQKADDKEFAHLIYEVATDIAGMDTFNAAVRIWSGSEGKLTSLYAARVPQGEKYREILRKFKHHEQAERKIPGVEVHKLLNARLQKDAPELFGADAAVYVATTENSIWFAAGPQAMERLEQAVEKSLPGKGAATGGNSGKKAVDVRADVHSLAAAWDAIGVRFNSGSDAKGAESKGDKDQPESRPAKASKASKASKPSEKDSDADNKSDRKKTLSASTVKDLELHKIAGKSFKKGDGKFTMSVTQDGDKAKVLMTSDEGILRFVGNVLSAFTKENLED
jgi:hypothetical protein